MSQPRRIGRWRRVLSIEALEDRTVLSNVTAMLNNGVLTITGDNMGDNIMVMGNGPGNVTVSGSATTVNGDGPAPFTGVTSIVIQLGNGNNSLAINTIMITGSLSATLGIGNNTITYDSSTIPGGVSFVVGTENVGATGSNSFEANNDVDDLSVSLLNQGMISGALTGSINMVMMSSITVAGNLNLRVDKGIPGAFASPPPSTIMMSGISTGGNLNLVQGDYIQSMVMGAAITGSLITMAGNGDFITVDPDSVDGTMDITMGNGGVNGAMSLTCLGVTTGDPRITGDTNPNDRWDVRLIGCVFGRETRIVDKGDGNDTLFLMQDQFIQSLDVKLSKSGVNTVFAQGVATQHGSIDNVTVYQSGGGNSGYTVNHNMPP